MNRKYTAQDYLNIIRKIRAAFKKYKPAVPHAITCDIIIGFPGETKKQLEDSAEIMRKAKFDMVFFGQFSPRPSTAAWKMKDNVSKKEKARREKYLNEILKKTCHENNKKYINKAIEVLIEKEKDGNYFGKTRTGKNVKIISNKKNLVGKIIKVHPVKSSQSEGAIGTFNRVKITKANVWNLEGIQKF
jgi:tRNA-2-methylthio-N6-dimethylallyladenosine synthase